MRTFTYTLQELTKALLKAEGVHDGHWELGFNLEIGVSAIKRPEEEHPAPSAVVRIMGCGVSEKAAATPGTIDASALSAE